MSPSSRPQHVQLLVLERRDPARNMARFYVLSIEPTLFGDVALVREWGRLGTQGRRRLDLFREHATASEALDTWLGRKVRRGYQVAPNCCCLRVLPEAAAGTRRLCRHLKLRDRNRLKPAHLEQSREPMGRPTHPPLSPTLSRLTDLAAPDR